MASTAHAPTQQPFADSKAGPTVAPSPRKRRRRTGTGGAADDCFACRNRGVKCDRKRPYCTQCIDLGRECSGYKTTLTWGVGVASRGKLRGLSCPIANKNADGSDISPVEREAKRRKSSTSKVKNEDVAIKTEHKRSTSEQMPPPAPASTRTLKPLQAYVSPAASSTTPQSPIKWHTPGYHDHVQHRQSNDVRLPSLGQAQLHRLETTLLPPLNGLPEPHSGRSVSSYAETEFYSPLELQRSSGSLASQGSMPSSVSGHFLDQAVTASAKEDLSSNGSSSDSQTAVESASRMNFAQSHAMCSQNGTVTTSNQANSALFNEMLYDRDGMLLDTPAYGDTTGYNIFDTFQIEDEEANNDSDELAMFDARFSNPFFHIPPRMQTLMNYYDRNVCPYLVAFDGAENPYRKQVLQLAMNNEGLQNAIAALATNNLRMRKKDLRQIGFVDGTEGPFGRAPNDDSNEPTAEETCYKQTSIDYLNMQLLDSRAAQDDSVLATLLILCLFHVCDSGFSKFKTQLAGVQKLLSLREPSTQSDFTRWVEMFFTWFDVMTSTVNDREMQIKGESLAMLDFSTNLGAMEQFSGCDGRLFKIVARLGSLNLLSQGRPVKCQRGNQHAQRPFPLQKPKMWSTKRKRPITKARTSKSLSPADYENIDGNGWGTPILSSDEDAEGSADDQVTATDDRAHFWTEWNDIRNRLQAWEMDVTSPVSPNAPSDLAELNFGQRHLAHINESFRYAALLYTERLGNPLLPSSHDQFQVLVSRALYHITSLPVTSCANKFLLWPLFIIGTECADEDHRNIVRNRCRDLTEESGFFNNISSLDVLERVWREVGHNVRGSEAEEVRARRRDSEASTFGHRGQAFRWRKAMDRVNGEYIVI
ncbi:hypothetical protein LTR37_009540 [Vermiconidia calcicola]|uniref:Uncharacterized protein n=1 Tax=Vermiconidia calcicola TaxID=1690605 RepID=A0ACC3N8N6_9PEZI|nr:hypothetical protein LTR37_009540 [Vermiconidia calcicola]